MDLVSALKRSGSEMGMDKKDYVSVREIKLEKRV